MFLYFNIRNLEIPKYRSFLHLVFQNVNPHPYFRKSLHTILKKFLDNRSKRFANTTQTFFNKRGF